MSTLFDQATELERLRAENARLRKLLELGNRPVRALVRNTDNPTAHQGAQRIDGKRVTRKQQVLDRLRQADGNWVDAHELCNARCGGGAGLRRVRELREAGWPVEVRFKEGTSTQYRIAPQ